ncbi:unnamed protein product [Thlaspi arvense]|uniref:Uncharacterized protein n=1 Tax=Thlaspi arvense TaxID=13288 RepID=A0AAU9R827_THLAR|nr:unnamed protein product [Thlaspi arvense]
MSQLKHNISVSLSISSSLLFPSLQRSHSSLSMYPPRRGGLPARGYVGREPHAPLRAGNSCEPPGFPLRSINELLQAPARRNQPTLHPEKIDGRLW